MGDLCACARGACEDKARRLRWGVIFQPHIQPASKGIKNEEAEEERLSKPMTVNGVYALAAANRRNTQAAHVSLPTEKQAGRESHWRGST